MTPSGTYRHAHMAQGPFFQPKDVMRHNLDILVAWTTFVLDKSEGFMQAGVQRLNDSIRTYILAILGAQAQAKANILKTRTGFDTRNNYLSISKTRLPRLLTIQVASPATRKHKGMRPHPLTSCAE